MIDEDLRRIQRQAFAGMLWSKQYFHYDVTQWLTGDAGEPKPPMSRLTGRNSEWVHANMEDVISMPDKWEYPWFAAWDWAFHLTTLAYLDLEYAKNQLILLCQCWYMHPNGQLPAYEWNFSDVNPPVQAWAALRLFEAEQRQEGKGDRKFLEIVFTKLLLNFTWWVNRKDPRGLNVFQGGFLGMDNIGSFDRSAPLPVEGTLVQSDGTSWMAMYSLNMLRIAIELAQDDDAYEDIATKFFEHFLMIGGAMTNLGGEGMGLWDDQDNFFYDWLMLKNGEKFPMRIRSLVGLIPIFAVEVIDASLLQKTSGPSSTPTSPSPNGRAALRFIDEHVRWNQAGNTADLKDKLLRAHAEVENIRKRSEREKEETAKYAVTRFARDIVNVGDNFQRAIDAVPPGAAEQDAALKSFLEGVTMTERELLNVLDRHGIKRVQPVGEPFNPHLHQAVMENQAHGRAGGTVVQVFQAGFMIEDRVLRPAMVAVSKGGPKPAQAPDGTAGPTTPPPVGDNSRPG